MSAIVSGNYKATVWLYECAIEQYVNIRKAMKNALRSNNIQLINYIYVKFRHESNAFDSKIYDQICSCASIETFNWIYDKQIIPTSDNFNICAKNKRIDLLEWLYEKGLRPPSKIYSDIAEEGDLDVVKWLRSKNIPIHENTLNDYIPNSTLEVLDFFYNEGCRFNASTHELFSNYQILPDKIKWMIDHGFEMNQDIFENITRNGCSKSLEFILTNNFPIDRKRIMEIAIESQNEEILQILFDGGFEFNNSTYADAIRLDAFDTMDIIRSNGIEPESSLYLEAYGVSDSIGYLDWLYSNGCKIPNELKDIVRGNSDYSHIEEWIKENRGKPKKSKKVGKNRAKIESDNESSDGESDDDEPREKSKKTNVSRRWFFNYFSKFRKIIYVLK